MTFEEYLRQKHLEYCNRVGRIITEREWVLDVLNKELPPSDKLAYVSVNQWMNGGRNPDAKNIFRLIDVFGPEIMPILGISMPHDLAALVTDWRHLPDDTRTEIMQIVEEAKKINPVAA